MTQAITLDINLLLAGHDDQLPVLRQALDGISTAREPRPALPEQRLSGDESGGREDLRKQGWGVLAPPGERGDQLLELMRPLIDRRSNEQAADVRVFRSPPSSDSDVSLLEALQWRNRWNDANRLSSASLPRYLLILGDLEQVPLAVQRALSVSTNHAVGRLSFTHDEHYRAYADKLCRQEREARKSPQGAILVHGVRDGSQATRAGYDNLLRPMLSRVQIDNRATGNPVREIGSQTPWPGELYTAASSTVPTVLFAFGHGEGAPAGGWPSLEEQHRFQGSMSFGGRHRIAGHDIADRSFLPGGALIMHSAFSAGTPFWSSYLGWLERLLERGTHREQITRILASRPLDDKPFVGALPQAALANPNGPIAFIGHVDLAWSCAFLEPCDATGSRTQALVDMMTSLASGHRIGLGMRALFEYLLHANAYLVSLYKADDDAPNASEGGLATERERALWWMIREELAGYVLLGDPAARLAVQARPSLEPAHGRRAPTDAERQAQERREKLERAIAEYILGHPPEIALGREGLEMNRKRFVELADAYRKAGAAAIEPAVRPAVGPVIGPDES